MEKFEIFLNNTLKTDHVRPYPSKCLNFTWRSVYTFLL